MQSLEIPALVGLQTQPDCTFRVSHYVSIARGSKREGVPGRAVGLGSDLGTKWQAGEGLLPGPEMAEE